MSEVGPKPEALARAQNDADDPSRRFATANYRIAKGSFALDVGCLTQATFAERPCCRILQGFPEIKTDRLNCGQARSAIDVWSTTMMIGKMA